MARKPGLELIHRLHQRAVDVDAHKRRRHIKHRLDVEAFLLEARIVSHRAADIARAHNDDVILVLKAQNLANALLEIGDVVTIALLAKTAEAIDILTDLGGGQVHTLTQLLRRNTHNARLFQLAQMTEIHRKSTHHGVRHSGFISHL